jgi:hypothetical protein
MLPTARRSPRPTQDRRRQPSKAEIASPPKAGRPPGPPSTIVNLRIPLDLLAQLDRYIDQLEVQTGLKANRGMLARRALALFLETHATAPSGRTL